MSVRFSCTSQEIEIVGLIKCKERLQMNDQFLCFKGCSHRSSYSGLQKKNFLIGIVKFSRSNEGAALTFRKDKRWRKWSDITRYVTGSLAGNTSCQRSCRMNRRVATHCVLVVPQRDSLHSSKNGVGLIMFTITV